MPWNKNKHGDREYKTSLYAKEELPTWEEVYDEFYKNKINTFDPNNEDHVSNIDLYWKIPRRKVLLATVCNQFNKMLFEDGYINSLIKMLKKSSYPTVVDIKFVCEYIPDPIFADTGDKYQECMNIYTEFIDSKFVGKNSHPPIYTIANPNGISNPFITSDVPRIDIADINDFISIHPIIRCKDQHNNYFNINLYYPTNPVYNRNTFCNTMVEKIIEFMMTPYKEYFENGVGWKDDNGNLIESAPPCRACEGSGFDPAL